MKCCDMWVCPKCKREFKRVNQSHYCGKAPETVSEYIALQDPEIQARLTELRNLIQSSGKDIKEGIAWSMPIYKKENRAISFAACQKHISFYIGEEAIETFKARLPEFAIRKNAVYLPYDKTLPAAVIRDIVTWYFD